MNSCISRLSIPLQYIKNQQCKVLSSLNRSTLLSTPRAINRRLQVNNTHNYATASVSSCTTDNLDSLKDYDAVDRVNTQLSDNVTGRLFAVIHIAGKQRKITANDIIVIDKDIAADIGERIRLNKVMMVGACDFSIIGCPILSESAANVEATVIEKTLSHTDVVFRFQRREDYKRTYR